MAGRGGAGYSKLDKGPSANVPVATIVLSTLVALLAGVAIAGLVIAIQNRPAGFPPTPAKATPICSVRNVRATGRARVPVDKSCLRLQTDYKLETSFDRRHAEDECDVAINPTNPNNIIVTSHQGLFVGWNADGIWFTKDGGNSWEQGTISASRCQGPSLVGDEGDYLQASDPTVVFGADGVAYFTGNNFNVGTDLDPALAWAEGMPVFKSYDGGATWLRPTDVNADDGQAHYNDRVILSAHPTNKGRIYHTWADYPCYSFVGACYDESARFRWTEDGGTTWKGSKEGNIVYYDRDIPGVSTWGLPYTWYCPVFVLPTNGSLVMTCGQWADGEETLAQRVVVKSYDNGETWQTPIVAAEVGVFDGVRPQLPLPNTQLMYPLDVTRRTIRAPLNINYAMNKHNGYLYGVGTTSTTATGNAITNVNIHMSKDGGVTWTAAILVNAEQTDVQSFLPGVAVADDGTVAVQFYDDRNNVYADASTYLLDVWLVLFDKDLNRIGEARITEESFDYQASNHGTGSSAYGQFLGDYVQLEADRNEFVGVYAAVEQEFTGVLPLAQNGSYAVDDEDRQNLFVFHASALCGYTPSHVTFSRASELTRAATKKRTFGAGKRGQHKRTLSNLELARLVIGHRKGRKKANDNANPLYLAKFNVTLDDLKRK